MRVCVRSLLLNGVVCTMQDKNDTAEMFFETAVTYEPQSILAWTMFGNIYYLLNIYKYYMQCWWLLVLWHSLRVPMCDV